MIRKDVNGVPAVILFLLGPSGSGKSTLASRVKRDPSLLHLEIDRFPEGDGIDREDLRLEWDAYWSRADARSLAAVLGERARAGGRAGVVVSFPSNVVLSRRQAWRRSLAADPRAGPEG